LFLKLIKVTEIKGIVFAGFYKAVSSSQFRIRIRRLKMLLILSAFFRKVLETVWKADGCLGFHLPSVRKNFETQT